MISGLVNSELKHKDSSLTGTLLNTGAYQVALSNIAQGDDYNMRNGRSILLKALSLRMTVSRGATAAATQMDHIGWAIIMDTRPDEGTSTWGSVFDGLTPWSHVDTQTHSGRFVILARGQLTLDGTHQQANITRYINLKGIHSKFDGTAATDYDKNTLFLIGLSDATTSNEPVTAGEIRVTYYDN